MRKFSMFPPNGTGNLGIGTGGSNGCGDGVATLIQLNVVIGDIDAVRISGTPANIGTAVIVYAEGTMGTNGTHVNNCYA